MKKIIAKFDIKKCKKLIKIINKSIEDKTA